MKFETMKKMAIYMAFTFALLSIWHDPAGAADAAGEFVGGLGNFFATALDKFTTFAKNLF